MILLFFLRRLGTWGVAVHFEEEMVVKLVKRVRMPPSAAVTVRVVVLVGGDDGGVSCSVDPIGNLRSEGGHN
jgi:hypothetical protein